jgi:hypothetical protein
LPKSTTTIVPISSACTPHHTPLANPKAISVVSNGALARY